MNNLIKRGLLTYKIHFQKPLLIIKGSKGIMACKYIDISTANKAGDAVCLFSNVNNFDDMLESNVVECTKGAEDLGIKNGMKGKDVVKIIE